MLVTWYSLNTDYQAHLVGVRHRYTCCNQSLSRPSCTKISKSALNTPYADREIGPELAKHHQTCWYKFTKFSIQAIAIGRLATIERSRTVPGYQGFKVRLERLRDKP
jgi:hypothetical protein